MITLTVHDKGPCVGEGVVGKVSSPNNRPCVCVRVVREVGLDKNYKHINKTSVFTCSAKATKLQG